MRDNLTIVNNTPLSFEEIFPKLKVILKRIEPGNHIFHTYQDFRIVISVGLYPKGIRCEVNKYENS